MSVKLFTESPNPVLTMSLRNGAIETVHRGIVCVVGASNQILYQLGNIQQYVYPRSSMKLIQVLPLILSGAADHYQLTLEEIAVMCASHNAEPRHLQVVRNILDKANVAESCFACGPHNPLGEEAHYSAIRSGICLADIHNNCSGKHAGFLMLAKFLGAPTEGYLDPKHPVQQKVRELVVQMYEIEEDKMIWGIDGCSAPNYAMPLYNHAIGFKNLCKKKYIATKLGKACSRVVNAVTTFPFMIAGSKRFCTDLIKACKGRIIGKLGAQGVYGMGVVGQEMGCAIKIDDGATGPQYNIASKFLECLHIFSKEDLRPLSNYKETPIYNCQNVLTGHCKVPSEVLGNTALALNNC